MKLTPTTVKSLELPAGVADKKFFDDELPGFALRLRATGARSWIVQYDVAGRAKTMTLGTPVTLELNMARRRAKEILAARTLGQDPAAEKRERRERAAET